MKRHTRLATYIDGDNPQRYREMIIGDLSAGMKRLTLVFNDNEIDSEDIEDHEYIVLPLGKSKTVPKDKPKPESPAEYNNFLVPLVVKRHGSSDFDLAKGKELRQGWLYIYCNGYLWREMMIDSHAFTFDVNLRRYQGQEFRPATGEADCRVMVPWKIGGVRQTIEIAYSEVQWSWARINALGGMNPDKDYEIRIKDSTPLAQDDPATCGQRRKERMQDISDELDQWVLNDGESTANIVHIDNATADIYSLNLHTKGALPVVFIDDPLGHARDLMQQINREVQELGTQVKRIGQKDFYDSAIIAYNLFFDPKNAGQYVETGRARPGHERPKRFEKNLFGQCGDKTDRNKIEELLEVASRKQRRQTIRNLQYELVRWLDGCNPQGEPISRDGFISYNSMMLDYFTAHGELYATSWLVKNDIISTLSIEPSTFDYELDLEENREVPPLAFDLRAAYKYSLLEEHHPLHHKLFPSEAQAPVRSEDPVDLSKTENDGLGTFRADVFVPLMNNRGQIGRRFAGALNQAISDLKSHYTKLWQDALETRTTQRFDVFFRLDKALNPTELESLLIQTIDEISDDRIILQAKACELRALEHEAAVQMLKKEKLKIRQGQTTKAITLVDEAGETIGSTDIAHLAHNKGTMVSTAAALENAPLSKLKIRQAIGHSQFEVTTITKSSRLARALEVPELESNVDIKVKASAIRTMRKTLLPAVILFEIWNLNASYAAFEKAAAAKQDQVQKFVDLANASTDLAFAIMEGIQALTSNESLHIFLAEDAVSIFDIKVGLAPFTGFGTGIFSGILSLRECLYAVKYNDNDTAVGHAVMASGFFLASLAIAGGTDLAIKIPLLSAFPPLLWVFTGIIFLGAGIVALCQDEPIERWAANGPFSLVEGAEELSYLRTNPKISQQVLCNALYTPQISGRNITTPIYTACQKGDFEVTISLPKFRLGFNDLDVRASWEVHTTLASGLSSYPQQTVYPYMIQQLTDDSRRITGFKYFYSPPQRKTARPLWQAKARLFMDNDLILPDGERKHVTGELLLAEAVQKPVKRAEESDTAFLQRWEKHHQQEEAINPKQPGWVYTTN